VQRLDVLSDSSDRGKWIIPVATLVLLVAFFGGSALLYRRSVHSTETIPGILLGSTDLGAVPFSDLRGVIEQEAQKFKAGALQLQIGKHTLKVKRAEVGAAIDVDATRRLLEQVGKSGSFVADLLDRVQSRRSKLRIPLVTRLDRDRALAFYTGLKSDVDRLAIPPRLDLDKRSVIPGRAGYRLQVYDCLVATDLALRRGNSAVKLAVNVREPDRRFKDLKIDQTLGHFVTVYSLANKYLDRGFNLKVGASKLDGTILGPGESFSFNEVVGPRTKAEGYRMAGVISEGEVIDGMAGGSCQLSSTLFAASFFAGLELVSSRPHTRPSSYIKMGLDATVSYPSTDLKLKNPYSFPVVFHFKVNSGKVRVRILGQARPWSKVVFEREVSEVLPFKEVSRKDQRIPRGERVVSQRGVPGFKLKRRRHYFKMDGAAAPAKSEERELRYPPTTQFINEGTGPADPEWKRPNERPPFGEVSPQFKLAQ
jgi:vancomycin resistance protein YoaR